MGKFLDAAEIILRRSGEAMKVTVLTEKALSERLLENSDGKTPSQTMKAKLSVDIRRNGQTSRFKRVGPGLFALRDSATTEYAARPYQKVVKRSEEVLVFPARLLQKLGAFHGIRRDVRRYEPLLDPKHTKVLPRIEAETNFAYKQVISYVIVRHKSAVLRFIRGSYSSVQSFLKGRLCIGFGGHVQGADQTLFDAEDSGYFNSIVRELTEELRLPPGIINEDSLQMVGVLNDDSSLVGKLHFAFVHILDLDGIPEPFSAKSLKREKSINQLRFIQISRLGEEYESYEYWSKLCIQEFFKGSVTIKCHVHPVRNFSLSKHPQNIAVVGTIGSGKTELSTMLHDEFGYELINTGKLVQDILGVSIDKVGRSRVQSLAYNFIQSPSGPETLAEAVYEQIKSTPAVPHLIDGLRNLSTYEALKRKLEGDIALVYVESTVDNAYAFYRTREHQRISFEQFIDILQHNVEADVPSFLKMSNIVIYNHGTKKSFRDETQRFFKGELR